MPRPHKSRSYLISIPKERLPSSAWVLNRMSRSAHPIFVTAKNASGLSIFQLIEHNGGGRNLVATLYRTLKTA
jgi:hypothetical protein